MAHAEGSYYVPHGSNRPAIGCVALGLLGMGAALWFEGLHNGTDTIGPWITLAGFVTLIIMFFTWFGDVIRESRSGLYSAQMDRTFRMGMSWFIFSEVMFFAAFFGTLFYARQLVIPWLGGEDLITHLVLFPDFSATWPSNGPENVGGTFKPMGATGLPLINTILLVTSGITLTQSHHALKENHRTSCILWMGATILLGLVFLALQVEEYIHAYTELGLTLGSGIYGSTFFMLTGFHGVHVTLGAIMLIVIFFRLLKGHFSPEQHFGYEAVAWYWHFVDYVWLGLYVFVYWL